MRLLIASIVASTVLVTGVASADPLPFSLPQLPPITLPNGQPLDLNGLQRAAQTCTPVEIAPGIYVPIPCATALPKVPDNAPTIELPSFVSAPPMVDLRTMNLDGPVKDQRQTGVCFAFALTSVLESSLRKQGRADVLSPLHVVAADTWDDLWTGKPNEAITQEVNWPYDPIKACMLLKDHDSCEQSYGVSVDSWQNDPALAMERNRVRGMGSVFAGRAQVLKKSPVDQALTALASGREVYINIQIDSAAWGWRGVKNGVLSEYATADRGGHAVVLVGYRTLGLERQFLIHNSWGAGWGENGYAWISERGLRAHLMDAYLVDAIVAGPTTVQPPPVQAQTACSQGTAYDLGAARCAPVCPSGLAPFGGRCWLG